MVEEVVTFLEVLRSMEYIYLSIFIYLSTS